MTYLLAFITAMVISMALIPLMVRIAPKVGMVDRPDPRKVHAKPIPRAGGVGIVLGALVPIFLWLPMDTLMNAYLFGAIVLLVFGVWDDICELGHYTKFIGQFLAVVAVVYHGELYVTHLPFMGLDTIPASFGMPFTVFAMIGVINALNHSDGLDGLAGGMSLLSLASMSYLAFISDGSTVVFIACATLGGVFGFLRFNTHPARVFMGDGGSQFLGFTMAFLVVYLVERVNPAFSPALPALLLGLPVIDILAVFAQRAYHRMNWFRASRNHIHHRLLQLGFDHYEAVVIGYSIQAVFVISALFLSYESDALILAIYLAVATMIFVFLVSAESMGWRAHASKKITGLVKVVRAVKAHKLFTLAPISVITVAISAFFVLVGLASTQVPRDLAVISAILAPLLVVLLLLSSRSNSIVVKAVYYVTAAFTVYLTTKYLAKQFPALETVELVYFSALAVIIGFAVRYVGKSEFTTTPLDYLVIFIALVSGILLNEIPGRTDLGLMAIKLIILFYGCELVTMHMKRAWNILNVSTVVALALLSVRGLL
jgi:UDP-GlcNAc:undecaprenyl-phosphate GlcNAc-1-phosphate transferase